MKKPLFVGLFALLTLLLCSSMASAGDFSIGLNHTYLFNDSTAGQLKDYTQTNDSTSVDVQGLVAGKCGQGWDFDGVSNDDVQMPPNIIHTWKQVTIACWYYLDAVGSPSGNYPRIMSFDNGGSEGFMAFADASSDVFWARTNADAAEVTSISTSIALANNWFHVVMTYDGTNQKLYLNGTLEDTDAQTGAYQNLGAVAFGSNPGGAANYINGILDDCYIWDIALNATNITDLYNGGDALCYNDTTFTGTAEIPSFIPSLNLTWTYPKVNQSYNTPQINFTFGVNVSHYNGLNCSLYHNSTLNLTINNIASDSVQTFIMNYTSSVETSYLYNISCKNNETNGSLQRVIYVDNIFPIISSSLKDNLTVGSAPVNISYQINFTDTFLFKFNVSTTYGYNVTFNFTGGTTSYSYDGSVNLTGLPYGTNYLTSVVCDGHTAKYISSYKYTKEDNGLTYRFGSDWVTIEPANKGDYEAVSTTKLIDRYTFGFTRTDTNRRARVEKYIVSSSQPIDIRGKFSHYQGHLVISNLNKWVDFANEVGYLATSKRIDDNSVEITVFVDDSAKQLEYTSIGDLNCVTQTDEFINFVANATSVVQSIETDTITYTLNVTRGSASSNALFYYNNTARTGATVYSGSTFDVWTKTVTLPFVAGVSNATHPFYWAYNVTGTNTESRNTTVQNNTVYRMRIVQCNVSDGGWWFAQNFSVQDEGTSAAVDVNVSGTYEVWVTAGQTRLVPFRVTMSNNFSACVFPSFASYTSDINFAFGRTGYGTRNYVQDGYTINNITELVTLRLLTSGTTLTIIVNDDDDNDVAGATVQILRDFTGNETWEIVDSEITNWGGEVSFDVNLDEEYKIRIYRGGVLERDDPAYKIVTTTLYFTLSKQQSIWLDDYLAVESIIHNLSYNNETNVASLYWNDLGGVSTNVCLNITNYNIQTYGNCSTLATGTFTYLVPNLNTSYEVFAWTTTYSGNLFLLDSLGIDKREAWKKYGADGLMYSLIIYLVIVFLAFESPVVAIFAGNVAFVMIYLFGFMYFGWVELIGVIVVNTIIGWRISEIKK